MRRLSFVAYGAFSIALVTLGLACEPFTGGTGGATSTSGSDASSTGTMETSSSTGMDCTVTGCAAGANATGECKNGVCEYTCAANFGDCDADPSDCEADLTMDGNCGGCAVNCAKSCVPFGTSFGCTEPVELTAGNFHTCARTGDGLVYCWGRNNQGQLGIGGGTTETSTPSKVPLPPNFVAAQISAGGDATCVVGQEGELACWGNDGTSMTTPVVYAAAPKVSSVSVGGFFLPNNYGPTLLMMTTGEVRQLQVSSGAQPTITGVKAAQAGIAAGGFHACVFDASGVVSCLGDDTYGQLGQGTTGHGPALVEVGAVDAVALAAGFVFTCALDPRKRVTCWGDNMFHQVSSSGTTPIGTPTTQSTLTGVDQIDAGGTHVAAVVAGKLFLWGDNQNNETSPSMDSAVVEPTEYAGISGVVQAALGDTHTCVLLQGGGVKCWGNNFAGQCGTSTVTDPVVTPTTVLIP